jgi:hypothetical protein
VEGEGEGEGAGESSGRGLRGEGEGEGCLRGEGAVDKEALLGVRLRKEGLGLLAAHCERLLARGEPSQASSSQLKSSRSKSSHANASCVQTSVCVGRGSSLDRANECVCVAGVIPRAQQRSRTFSHRTCLPAFSAARQWGAWLVLALATYTTSIVSSASNDSREACQPRCRFGAEQRHHSAVARLVMFEWRWRTARA